MQSGPGDLNGLQSENNYVIHFLSIVISKSGRDGYNEIPLFGMVSQSSVVGLLFSTELHVHVHVHTHIHTWTWIWTSTWIVDHQKVMSLCLTADRVDKSP